MAKDKPILSECPECHNIYFHIYVYDDDSKEETLDYVECSRCGLNKEINT